MSNKTIEVSQGSEFMHPLYGKFKVLSFINSKSVNIEFFNTGTVINVQSKDVRSLRVRDYNHPNMFGVGYMGYGKHKSFYGGKVRKPYSVWRCMLQRCYDRTCESYRFYSDCFVCEEWHNFQVFAEWFNENYVDGYHLDKDKKIKGNKIYSPSTCLFIPAKENIKLATQKNTALHHQAAM